MASPVDAASLPVAAAEESGAPGAAATPVAELAAWQTIELTDVRSSETFTLADLAGTLIVIEPMAIWCSNCLRQQQEVAKALKAFDADEVVYISLGVDPGEDARALGSYADEHDFGWRFAVSPRSLSRALARTFGDQVLAPPSTPRVIITPDGRVIGPAFGIADSKAVEMELREHLS